MDLLTFMLNLSTQKAKTNNGPSKTCFYEEPSTSMEPFYCIKDLLWWIILDIMVKMFFR